MYIPLKQITAAFCPLQPLVFGSLFCHHGHAQAFMLSHHINLGKIPGLINILPTARYYQIAGSWIGTDSRKRLDRFYKFRTGRFVRRPIWFRHAFRWKAQRHYLWSNPSGRRWLRAQPIDYSLSLRTWCWSPPGTGGQLTRLCPSPVGWKWRITRPYS